MSLGGWTRENTSLGAMALVLSNWGGREWRSGTHTHTEKLGSGQPCALKLKHKQPPRNSAHLFVLWYIWAEGRFYCVQMNKEASLANPSLGSLWGRSFRLRTSRRRMLQSTVSANTVSIFTWLVGKPCHFPCVWCQEGFAILGLRHWDPWHVNNTDLFRTSSAPYLRQHLYYLIVVVIIIWRETP